jgi:hypothetical protein
VFWGRYVVCNIATNKWLLLPDNLHSCGEARLGFNPIIFSHFHVFEYGKMREGESIGVSIYSSKSAAWIFKESKRGDNIIVSIMQEVCFLMFLCTGLRSPRSLLLIWMERHGQKYRSHVVMQPLSMKPRVSCVYVLLIFTL